MKGEYTQKRIALYGEEKHQERLEQTREWRRTHPEEVQRFNSAYNRKVGKYYSKKVEYDRTEIRRKRNIIRACDRKRYRKYKRIVAPDSQIHHEWLLNTANYTGAALVETDRHRHGFIDVIEILNGEITILTEF